MKTFWIAAARAVWLRRAFDNWRNPYIKTFATGWPDDRAHRRAFVKALLGA